jgi:hypothetical protein
VQATASAYEVESRVVMSRRSLRYNVRLKPDATASHGV